MHLGFLLTAILFWYLRTNEQTKTLFPKWKRYFVYGMLTSILFLILGSSIGPIRVIAIWLSHFVNFALIYLSFHRKEFQPIKPFLNAFLPLLGINALEDLVKLLAHSFHATLQPYFEAATGLAVVWMIVMWVLIRKQRKALALERQKAKVKEIEIRQAEILKIELEKQVSERTEEITIQKEELVHALEDLKSTQKQLIQSEKMASLGELTAGIAHEIKNPLNFVNNFAEVSAELLDELGEEIEKGDLEEVKAISLDLKQNLEKINHHGKRADSIVKGMLLHSRSSSGDKQPTNINALADEYLRLAYHGLRAKNSTFNAAMETDFDESINEINVISQDLGRVLLNLITNAFQACMEQSKSAEQSGEKFFGLVKIISKNLGDYVEIVVSDNAHGIPESIQGKIFQPFFTTKPAGSGTGLGLSLSYDIVKAHGGELKVESGMGEGSRFIVSLPSGLD